MTKRVSFRQRDLATAVKVIENSGQHVAELIVLKDGSVRIVVGSPNNEPPAAPPANPWDDFKL